MTHTKKLRERIREAGGFYEWANETLIRIAGPAQVGPYGPSPTPKCEHCGKRREEHVAAPDGSLRCPE
ncbi:hypothetical protein [Microbacterium karelineae]|uniref:hypothetical protein n=1 Tax=Microbacterium karelineae TaxID=2654283 RepID=UPI0012EAB9D2|nr:hypothetical protein [Microbacterium karelineae]